MFCLICLCSSINELGRGGALTPLSATPECPHTWHVWLSGLSLWSQINNPLAGGNYRALILLTLATSPGDRQRSRCWQNRRLVSTGNMFSWLRHASSFNLFNHESRDDDSSPHNICHDDWIFKLARDVTSGATVSLQYCEMLKRLI